MEGALIILIPFSVMLIGGIVAVLWWAVRKGQFDDLEGPAHAILMDDDDPLAPADRASARAETPDAASTGRPEPRS